VVGVLGAKKMRDVSPSHCHPLERCIGRFLVDLRSSASAG